MSVDGIEPSTSVLSGQRSTTELHTQFTKYYFLQRSTSPSQHRRGKLNYTLKSIKNITEKGFFSNKNSYLGKGKRRTGRRFLMTL